LAHELAHLRRRDHWVRWLELVVLGLYWWHPVAWWARRRFQQAEEQCCDAWVLWALPGLARTYAKALLETVEFLSEVRPVMPPAASGLGQVHLLKRRFAMILHDRWSPALSRPMRLAMLTVGLVALGISPWPLRVAAEPPADLDPATAEAADSEAAATTDDRVFAPTDGSAAGQPVPSASTPAVDPAAADDRTSDSEAEGETTVRVPVIDKAGRRRTVKVKVPARVQPHVHAAYADDGSSFGGTGSDDVHQRLTRLERMVEELVGELRRTRGSRRPADVGDPSVRDRSDELVPLVSGSDARRLTRSEARTEQLRRERDRLRARLQEIDRELGESAPVTR
jgi:hypothetical protein